MGGIVIRLLGILVIVGGLGLAGFAYLGDLDPERERVTRPVELEFER